MVLALGVIMMSGIVWARRFRMCLHARFLGDVDDVGDGGGGRFPSTASMPASVLGSASVVSVEALTSAPSLASLLTLLTVGASLSALAVSSSLMGDDLLSVELQLRGGMMSNRILLLVTT